MTQLTDTLRDSKRLRLIATALELMQYERTDSAVIPIPGTEPQRYVVVGTAATVARLLEIAPTTQAVTQQAAPTAWLATDLDGRGDVAFTKEEATRRAGEGCTEFFPLYDAAPATKQAAKAETAEQVLNGIPATMRHDEGAIARCSYCHRYSLDPATLSDRQPACECGKQHGWSGSFKRPGSGAKWSGKAPGLAPTTSTVSVPCDCCAAIRDAEAIHGDGPVSAPEEVRNQALEEADEAIRAVLWQVENGDGLRDEVYGVERCRDAVRALRTITDKGETA